MGKPQARETAVALLRSVGIPEPERRLDQYPFELSGGMRQRVTIAIAISCGPKLLMADEPTTALDVTVQAQILNLLQDKQRERYMAMILVTHDLGVVAGRTDQIAVMYAGKIVERAPTRKLFAEMRMPYTEALVKSIPRVTNASHTRLLAITGRPPDLAHPPHAAAASPPAARTPRPAASKRSRRSPPPTAATISSPAGIRSAPRRARPRSSTTSSARRPQTLAAVAATTDAVGVDLS